MRIAFHVNQFSIRGSEIASFAYAKYNQTLLGNVSLIVAPRDCTTRPTSFRYDPAVERKFADEFGGVLFYTDKAQLERLLVENQCDAMYALKSGEQDGIISTVVPTFVHCIFTCSPEHRHGAVYAAVSRAVSAKAPVVPHICEPVPPPEEDLRATLGIPPNALVFGRHGGFDTFNIPFVHRAVVRALTERPDTWFLFMNTRPFLEHPRVVYLEKTVCPVTKGRFIASCDAMLHARLEGESFGLAIAEFTSLKKPILTYRHKGPAHPHEHLFHHEVLGSSGLYYETEDELVGLLSSAIHSVPTNYSEVYSPEKVMAAFQSVFLSYFRYRIRILCNWSSSADLYRKWRKMLGPFPFLLVQSARDADYTVVINKPNDRALIDPKTTIVLGMEPDTFSAPRWHWYGPKESFLFFGDERYLNSAEWWLDLSHTDLAVSAFPKKHGTTVSTVLSSQRVLRGHRLRTDFVKVLEKRVPTHVFGWDNNLGFASYVGPLPQGKEPALVPYKYTFAGENTQRENYCTEKLFDALLCETLCFYWGCPNLPDHFPEDCYVPLDITNPEAAVAVVEGAIRTNQWEKRLGAIREAKSLILYRYSVFARIRNVIASSTVRKRVVNLDARPDRWARVQKQCESVQLRNVERFSAVVGSECLKQPEVMRRYDMKSLARLSTKLAGIVGCAESHYRLWEDHRESTDNSVMLILEDDITLKSGFTEHLADVIDHISDRYWDVLFLGYHAHEENLNFHGLAADFIETKFGKEKVVSLQEMFRYGSPGDATGLHGGGTFAYAVSREGAERLIGLVNQFRFYFPVDYFILDCAIHHGLKGFVVVKPLVTSPKFFFTTADSDIQG